MESMYQETHQNEFGAVGMIGRDGSAIAVSQDISGSQKELN